MSNRTVARLTAVVVALALSNSQNRFFPCNKLPFLSYTFGVATLLIIYATAELTYEAISDAPDGKRAAIVTIVVGCIAAVGGGFITMMTHICP